MLNSIKSPYDTMWTSRVNQIFWGEQHGARGWAEAYATTIEGVWDIAPGSESLTRL